MIKIHDYFSRCCSVCLTRLIKRTLSWALLITGKISITVEGERRRERKDKSTNPAKQRCGWNGKRIVGVERALIIWLFPLPSDLSCWDGKPSSPWPPVPLKIWISGTMFTQEPNCFMKIKALAGEITEISFNANFACVYKTVFVHRCHLFNAVQRYFEQIFHRIKLFSLIFLWHSLCVRWKTPT